MAPNAPSDPTRNVGANVTMGAVSNGLVAVGENISQSIHHHHHNHFHVDSTVQDKPCLYTPSQSLPVSAWTRCREIALNYDNLKKQFSLLTRSGEYGQSKELYWQILYFTGTREFWNDRIELSKEMLKLSIKEKDYKTSGLIWAKGVAYHQINTRNFSDVKISLQNAYNCFIKAKAYPEIGVVYEYSAALNEETRQVCLAVDDYQKAMKKQSGMDKYKSYLKKRFVEEKNKDPKLLNRIIELAKLGENFSSIKSFREALVDIELAITLYLLKDPEALSTIEKAYNLLHNEIQMPRNADKAKKVLFAIMEGKPIVEV